MADKDTAASGRTPASTGSKRRGIPILLIAGLMIGVAGAGAAAEQFLPAAMPASAQDAGKPVFVDMPEMALTVPNDGQPRQLRIKLSLELGVAVPGGASPETLMPRVYDALLTYLRTEHDDELAGSLALDRLRGDLLRRLDLVLGAGTVRDVLITSLVVG
jgi:flagellar FliL protein